MSLIPFILDLADELHEFSRCLVNGMDINDFGFGLYTGTDQQQPQQHQQQSQQQQASPRRSRTSSFSSFWMPSKRHHPYNRIKTACCAKPGDEAVTSPEKSDTGTSSISGTPGKSASYSVVNKNGFQVSMNVKQFAPSELSVKTIDNCIVVEGRHDDKEDGHGVISRHFVRKYMLPKGYDPNDVLSTLSSDGILTVKAPPPQPPTSKYDEPNERVIEIQPTPGPTPVVLSSAKDALVKASSKKIATSPLTSLEYHLPEKRQKVDLLSKAEEKTECSTLKATNMTKENKTDAKPVPIEETQIDSNDVEVEKADEQITEIVLKQREENQSSNVAEIENDVEKKSEMIEQLENILEKEQTHFSDDAEKKMLNERYSDSNLGLKTICENMQESCTAEDSVQITENIKALAENKIIESFGNLNKIDVDEEDGSENNENIINEEFVVATNKITDSETKTAVNFVIAKDTNATQLEESNTTESSNSNTTKTTTTIINKNNNSNKNSTNKITPSTTDSSSEITTDISAAANNSGNVVATGKISADTSNSADREAEITTTFPNNTKGLADNKAESAVDKVVGTQTAVLCNDTNRNIIEEVALLKSVTAETTSTADNIDENVILNESKDVMISTEELSVNTPVDSVECSLFGKKPFLGNGNNTTATQILGTKEMAD